MTSASELKRQRILQAATELFGVHGYGASMDSISKLADVSKQTIYSHFKTKDLLFETCMRNKCLEYQANEAVLDLNLPIEEALVKFGMGFHQTLLNPGAQQTYRNAVSNIDTHPEFTATYLEYGPIQTTKMLEQYLDKKVEDDTIQLDVSSHQSAIQLLLMFHGKAVYWRYLGENIEESHEQKHQYIKSCVDLFLSHTLK